MKPSLILITLFAFHFSSHSASAQCLSAKPQTCVRINFVEAKEKLKSGECLGRAFVNLERKESTILFKNCPKGLAILHGDLAQRSDTDGKERCEYEFTEKPDCKK